MKTNAISLITSVTLGWLTLSGAPAAQAASLQLTPSSLTLIPGSTSGFGFTFINDSTGYAVFNDTALSQAVGGIATYSDFIGASNDLFIVAPGATLTQSFNAATGTGAGELTLANDAPAGIHDAATLTLFYDVFSVNPGSPNFNSLADYVGSSQVSQSVSLTVAAVPEPGVFGLCGVGLILLARIRTKALARWS